MNPCAPSYYHHRFPSEIIRRRVWLYFRFALSNRDVEEMMHERGVPVDQDGEVLDIPVQSCGNRPAVRKFFCKLLKSMQYVPRVIITGKFGSYAAKAEVLPSAEHRRNKRLNNRAENSHQPTRERERRMSGFISSGHVQKFLSVLGVIGSRFRPGRHLLATMNYREIMGRRCTQWREVTYPRPAISWNYWSSMTASPKWRHPENVAMLN